MGLKTELTQKVAAHLRLEGDLAQCRVAWWQDSRDQDYGFQLTTEGFIALTDADIKSYPIKFEEELYITNQLTIWLNRHMPCPFFLTRDRIYVFSEHMAVQLMLFSGNLERFIRAKIDKLKD
jgi:hypothetical protein